MTEPENNPTNIRFAVVGLGLMGRRHCQVITAVEGASLAAVCDRDQGAINAINDEFECLGYTDFETMIANDDIDAVVLCLPSSIHAEYGIKAAVAGKHVITEKPMDSQSSQAEKLADACWSAGVVCAVICQNRYSDGLASLKMAVESELMGKPILVRATVKWFRHDEYYTGSEWRGRLAGEHGGVLINQAVHSIDTLQWLFGVPDNFIGYTQCTRPEVLEAEDTAVAIMRWNSGLLASLEASTSSAPGFDEAYEVQSSTASIKIVKGKVTHWYHHENAELPKADFPKTPESLDDKLKLFARQYNNIVAAISDKNPLDIMPEEAIAVVKTIEQLYGK